MYHQWDWYRLCTINGTGIDCDHQWGAGIDGLPSIGAGVFLSFYRYLVDQITIIISGVVGGLILNLAKGKNIRDGPLKLFTGSCAEAC